MASTSRQTTLFEARRAPLRFSSALNRGAGTEPASLTREFDLDPIDVDSSGDEAGGTAVSSQGPPLTSAAAVDRSAPPPHPTQVPVLPAPAPPAITAQTVNERAIARAQAIGSSAPPQVPARVQGLPAPTVFTAETSRERGGPAPTAPAPLASVSAPSASFRGVSPEAHSLPNAIGSGGAVASSAAVARTSAPSAQVSRRASAKAKTQSVPLPPNAAAATGLVASVPRLARSMTGRENWVDRHAPRTLKDLVGNGSVVKKLAEWLRDWEDVVLRGIQKKAAFRGGGGMPDNINARAALVSGPPGIGKTTSCRLVAKLDGRYDVLEYNASDARGQRTIQEMSLGIADNRTLCFAGGPGARSTARLSRGACIIMDEVDGMGAGDRGGSAALIKMIKKTRNPIICICNDAHSQKVRSLAFSCYDLKFTRPQRNTVAQRCAQIAAQMGLKVEPSALEGLAESCGSDMRLILNQLQFLARTPLYQTVGGPSMEGLVRDRLQLMSKDHDIMLTPFDACKKLLNTAEGARMSFRDRLDMFFVDYSLMGLLVHENYLRSIENKGSDSGVLRRCAYAADLMTFGDVLNARIRDPAGQDWSLLPDLGVASAVYPSYLSNGFVGFPTFPAWLGKNSTQSRMRRLNMELQAHLRLSTTVSCRSLHTSGYAQLLYKRMVDPLLSGTAQAVDQTVGILDAYGLRKEHLQEHLTELRQHLGGEDLFKAVDPKTKAAFTRELNSGGHVVRMVLPQGRKRKRGAAANEEDPDGDLLEGEVDAEPTATAPAEDADGVEGDSDDGGRSGLIKARAKAKAKGKAKAKAKATEALATDDSPGPALPKAKAKGRGKAKAKART